MSTLFETTLSAYEFGAELIKTEDLDPVYVILHRAKLSDAFLHRWLLAYWLFYSAGTASEVASEAGFGFYKALLYQAKHGGQRGTERRHFRGKACMDALLWFQRHFPKPEDAVLWLKGATTFQAVKGHVMQWPMFGPWISFKVADMLERVLGWPVSFEDCNLLEFYSEPRAGAEILAEQTGRSAEHELQRLTTKLQTFKAPPNYNRPCSLQEAETVLCKWKSYLKGHYYVGKDWKEIKHSLQGKGAIAQKLLEVAR